MVEIGGERPGNAQVGEELAGMAGILGGDQVHLLQDADRAKGDILQVPDGGGDYVESS